MTTKTFFPLASVFNANDSIDYSEGGIISKQVLKNAAGNVTLFSFDKGQGLSEHMAPFNALVQLVDGEAEIRIGGQAFLLKKGDQIIMPANVPHELIAVEPFKMCLIMIKGS